MTVKELIEKLEVLDGNRTIVFHSFIETGRGGSWIQVENFEVVDHDDLLDTYMFSIEGDEDRDGGYN